MTYNVICKKEYNNHNNNVYRYEALIYPPYYVTKAKAQQIMGTPVIYIMKKESATNRLTLDI